MTLIERLDKAWYPNHSDEWDAVEFRRRILVELSPEMKMLDIGAGRGATKHMQFQGLVAEVVGSDVDPAVMDNQQIDRAIHTPDGTLEGLDDDYFDIIVSKDVLEHVAEPEAFFAEVHRVLKPGGLFMAKTPNRTHYVPIIARLTPMWFHQKFNKMRGRAVVDTFPTVYKANSRQKLFGIAKQCNLEIMSVDFQEGRPEYLRFNPIIYFVGIFYERTVNSLKLEKLKAVIYFTVQKAK